MIKNGKISLSHYVKQMEGNIVSDMDGEKVMLNVKKGKYFNLGEMGGYIWDLMDDRISIEQLIAALMADFEVEQSVCEEQVISFLEHLLNEGLIEMSKEANEAV